MKWYCYDKLNGETVLKTNDEIPRCPICVNVIKFIGYKGECCGLSYDVDGKWLIIKQPFAEHDKKSGRGWQSLKEVSLEDIRNWWNWKTHTYSRFDVEHLLREIEEDVEDVFARDNDFEALNTNFEGQKVVSAVSCIIWNRCKEMVLKAIDSRRTA